jgi:F-box protein 11
MVMQRFSILILCLAGLLVHGAGADNKDTLDSIRSKRPPRKSSTPSRPAPSRPRTKVPRATKPVAAVPQPASPAPLIVAPLGGTPYRTLAAALKAAKPGAKIRVRSGIYAESLVLDRPVEIVPDQFDPGGIIVEGVSGPALIVTASAATVQGLTFRLRADVRADYCVDVSNGRFTLDDCEVTSGTKAAVAIRGMKTDAYVNRCRIKGSMGDGASMTDQAGATFTDCELVDNASAGMRVTTEAHPILQTCILRKNKAQGLYAGDGATPSLAQCDLLENAAEGLVVEKTARATLRGGNVRGNAATGVLANEKADLVMEGVTLTANKVGVEVHNSSVAILTACRMVGHSQNGLAFRAQSRGTVERTEISKCGWHGISLETGSDPIFRNCSSRENNATALIVNDQSRGTFEDCDFANGHDWSCVNVLSGSDPIMRRCKIRDSARGGMEISRGAKGLFEEVEVFGNAWSGITLSQKADPVLKGCTVRNNQHWGFYVYEDGRGTLENCDVRANGRGSLAFPTNTQPTIRESRLQ